jgi:hypothetical protein
MSAEAVTTMSRSKRYKIRVHKNSPSGSMSRLTKRGRVQLDEKPRLKKRNGSRKMLVPDLPDLRTPTDQSRRFPDLFIFQPGAVPVRVDPGFDLPMSRFYQNAQIVPI